MHWALSRTRVYVCLSKLPHWPSTRRASSGCWRAIGQSPRRRPSGWPNPPRICSGPAPNAMRPAWTPPGLTGVIAVDPEARTADVAGMCTYEDLVAATLPYGLAPLVVPQLKTITLGGAVTGLGIESTSFRNGLPHESVCEMDILTGAGELVTAIPRPARRSVPRVPQFLWHARAIRRGCGSSWSRCKPFVALRHLRFHSVADTGRGDGPHHRYRRLRRRRRSTTSTAWCSAPTRATCALGMQTATPGPVSDYTGQDIYYRSIQHDVGRRGQGRPADHPRLPVALGHRLVLVLAGVRRAEPDDLRRLLAAALPAQQLLLEAGRPATSASTSPTGSRSATAVRRASGSSRTSRCRSSATAEFLDWFLDNVPIEPIWLCPLRLRDSMRGWPLYPLATATHLRQRRVLVVGAGRRDRGRDQPADRGRRSASSTATSRCTPTRSTPATSSTSSTAARPTRL